MCIWHTHSQHHTKCAFYALFCIFKFYIIKMYFFLQCYFFKLFRKFSSGFRFYDGISSNRECQRSPNGVRRITILNKLRLVSYMILYMFQCHSPKSSQPLPLPHSPKDCSIHLCLFCCLAYRVVVTIFLNSTHSFKKYWPQVYMCSPSWTRGGFILIFGKTNTVM